MILKRLKNLWNLSEYKIDKSPELLDDRFKVLTKNVSTIQKKMATIIMPERDLLNEEIKDDTANQ